jgi:hypothetical protein
MRQGLRHGTWCACTSQSLPQEATGLTKPVRLFRHSEGNRPRDQVKTARIPLGCHFDLANTPEFTHPSREFGFAIHLASIMAAQCIDEAAVAGQ